jgi:predicted PurR-regulated permease PerM
VLGVALGITAVYVGFALLSGLIVPVALALVLAVLTLPLTNWLARRMKRGFAVALVVLLVFAVVIGLLLVFVHGIADVAPAIQSSLEQAVARIKDALGISDTGAGDSAASATTTAMTSAGTLTGWLAGAVGSLVSLFFGAFIATMVFFLVLLTPQETQGWIARMLPWPREQADRLFTSFGQVIRDYYKGCTILAAVNAVPIWLTALALRVEAAGSIFVVLFVSSYIPYVGAWIGGAFAVLMALGSGGTTDAVVMLVMVLLVNLVLQSIVQPFAYGTTMTVSPLGVFLATLLGSTLAGAFGAMMAAPVYALFTRWNGEIVNAAAAPVVPPAVAEAVADH